MEVIQFVVKQLEAEKEEGYWEKLSSAFWNPISQEVAEMHKWIFDIVYPQYGRESAEAKLCADLLNKAVSLMSTHIPRVSGKYGAGYPKAIRNVFYD